MNNNITHKLLILILILGLFGCDQLGEDINQITNKNVEHSIEGKVWELDYISEEGNILRDFPAEEDGYNKRVFNEYLNGEVKQYTLLVKDNFKKLTYKTVKYEIVEDGIKYESSETLDSIDYKDNLLVLTRAYSDSTIDYNYFLSDEDLSSAVHFTEWDSDIPDFEGKVWELDYISEEENVLRDFPADEDGYMKRVFHEYLNGEVKQYTLLAKGNFKKLTYKTVKYEIVEDGIKYESSETLDSIDYKDNLLVLTRAYSDSTIDYNYFISDEDLSSAVHFTEWDNDISDFEDKTWELDSITQNGQLVRDYPENENGYLKNIYIEYSDGVYTKYTELDKDGVKTITFQNKNYEVLGNSVKYDNIDTLDNISQDAEKLTIIRKVTLNGLEYNYKLKEIDLSEAVLLPENPNKTSLENRIWKVQKSLTRDTPEELMPKWAKVDVDGDYIQDYYTNFDMYFTFNDGFITTIGVYYLNQKIIKLEELYNSYTVTGGVLTQRGFLGGFVDNHFEVIENSMNLYFYPKDSEGNYDEIPKHTKFFEESNIDIFSLSEGDIYGEITQEETREIHKLEDKTWKMTSLTENDVEGILPGWKSIDTNDDGTLDTTANVDYYYSFSQGYQKIIGVYYLDSTIIFISDERSPYTVDGNILHFQNSLDNHYEVQDNSMVYNYSNEPEKSITFEKVDLKLHTLSVGDSYGEITDNESTKSITLEGNIWVLESLSSAGDITNFPTTIPFATGSNGEYDTSLVLNLYYEFNNGIIRTHIHTVFGIESNLEYSDSSYVISDGKLTWEGTSEPYSIDIVGDKLSLTRSFIDTEDLDYDDDTTEYVDEIYTFRLDNSIDVRNSVEEQVEETEDETSVIEDVYPGRGPFNLPAMAEWIELQVDYKANKYFLVDVTPNTSYRVFWDDEDEGSGKYSADVTMSAYTTDNNTNYFIAIDSGYNEPQTFTVGSEITKIMVQVCGEHSSGSVAFMVEELAGN